MIEEGNKIEKKEWFLVLFLLVSIKICFLVLFFYASHYIPKASYPVKLWMNSPSVKWYENLSNFDGAWFIRIAGIGYKRLADGSYNIEEEAKRLKVIDELGYEDGVKRNFGYRHWPLFPFLLKLSARVIPDYIIAGLVLVNLFYFLFGVFFYGLLRLDHSKEVSLFSLLLILVHPGAYSLNALYNETLFLFFCAGCFYFLRKKRWLFCALMGMGASLTRIEALVIFLPIIYEYFALVSQEFQTNTRFRNVLSKQSLKRGLVYLVREPLSLCLVLIPFGSFLVLVYFHFLTGNAFVFINVHEANIYGHFGFPWQMLYQTYLKGADTWLKELPLHTLLFVVIIFSFGKVRESYWLWMVLFFLFHTTNGNHSYLRYQIQCLPMFVALSVIFSRYRVLGSIYLVLSVLFSSLFCVMFINGYWVA